MSPVTSTSKKRKRHPSALSKASTSTAQTTHAVSQHMFQSKPSSPSQTLSESERSADETDTTTVHHTRKLLSSIVVPELSKDEIMKLKADIKSLSLSPSELKQARITLIGNSVDRTEVRTIFTKTKNKLIQSQTLSPEEIAAYTSAIEETGKTTKFILSSLKRRSKETSGLIKKVKSGAIPLNKLQPVFKKIKEDCGTEAAQRHMTRLKNRLLQEVTTEKEKDQIKERFIFVTYPRKTMSDSEMKLEANKLKLRNILKSGNFTAQQCTKIISKLKSYNTPSTSLQRWKLKAKRTILSKNLPKEEEATLLRALKEPPPLINSIKILYDAPLVISKHNISTIRDLIKHNLVPKEKIVPLRIAITKSGISKYSIREWFKECKKTINNSEMTKEEKNDLLLEIIKSGHAVAHIKCQTKVNQCKYRKSKTHTKQSEDPSISQQTQSTISDTNSSVKQQSTPKTYKSKSKKTHTSETEIPQYVSTLEHIRTGLLNPDMLIEAITFLLEHTPNEDIILALKSYKNSHPHSDAIVDIEISNAMEMLRESTEKSSSTWEDPLPLTELPTFEGLLDYI